MHSVRECNRMSCDIHCVLARELHVLHDVRILSPRALFTLPTQRECTTVVYIKVLGHDHVFEVRILISSGSDIIIQIQTRGFGVI